MSRYRFPLFVHVCLYGMLGRGWGMDYLSSTLFSGTSKMRKLMSEPFSGKTGG